MVRGLVGLYYMMEEERVMQYIAWRV